MRNSCRIIRNHKLRNVARIRSTAIHWRIRRRRDATAGNPEQIAKTVVLQDDRRARIVAEARASRNDEVDVQRRVKVHEGATAILDGRKLIVGTWARLPDV